MLNLHTNINSWPKFSDFVAMRGRRHEISHGLSRGTLLRLVKPHT
jgi:hypothetical protein